MVDFEQFYITWYSRAKYFAREYVHSESDAENIIQDVFCHLYERRDLMDAYTNLTAYLFTSIKTDVWTICANGFLNKKLHRECKMNLRWNFG